MEVVELEDLIDLANFHLYRKLMIDGMPSRPFMGKTFSPENPHSYFN